MTGLNESVDIYIEIQHFGYCLVVTFDCTGFLKVVQSVRTMFLLKCIELHILKLLA